ncbi:MAG: flavin reductase family protein [Anaerolineaceae bacterium]
MPLKSISPQQLLVNPYDLFDRQTLLLASGNFGTNQFNAMVIGWGSIGVMWNKPCMVVAVRPSRYTYDFIDTSPDFTVSAFPSQYGGDVMYLGTHSGRDENKLAHTHLTPTASMLVQSPSFAEAELILECKKIYWFDLDPSHFLTEEILKNYPLGDYHRMYYGEILAVHASDQFIAQE